MATLKRTPSSNPVWAELEALAIQYKSLPPATPPPPPSQGPGAPLPDPDRERLRQAIYRLLAATWVKMVTDDAAVGAGDEAATQMLRRDSALEKVFRAEAAKLARLHANDDLTQAFGGATQASAEAQQGFIAQRAQRYAQRQQTFLTGVLADWDADRGSLYTFISRAAASFLMDMHREFRAHGEAKLVQGATPARWVTAPEADGADAAAGDADWLGACRAWGVDSEKRPQRGQFLPDLQAHSPAMGQKAGEKWTAEAVSQPTIPKPDRLLDAQHDSHAPSAEEWVARQRAAQALDAAVQQLPDDLQRLFRMERSKLDFGLTDTEVARDLGLGSRNTLEAWRKRLRQALRGLLGGV